MKITSMLFAGEVKEKDKVKNRDYTLYEEGIYVGYRHFDRAGLEVSYPFGYGLSYGTILLITWYLDCHKHGTTLWLKLCTALSPGP